MRTGFQKTQKITEIYFSEASELITVVTYNTSLKKRLTAFAEEFPELCTLIADDDAGCLTFEISKDNFTFLSYETAFGREKRKIQGADEQDN